jgi:uncharacterized repeat protein (TIGR03843 family)
MNEILLALQKGKCELQGQFVRGSNYTFLVKVSTKNLELTAVYKPIRGEQPLWDFPTNSLAKREAAAFQLSQALNWDLVPPTVYRRNGPLGAGSYQLFVEHDPDMHYFNLPEEHRQRLHPVVVFDLLANNADRKAGHVLIGERDHIWLIDHGLCFHREDKLRTVIWDFAGQAIPASLLEDTRRLLNALEENAQVIIPLTKLLRKSEMAALKHRAEKLIRDGIFPFPDPERRPFPWPPL